MSQSMPSWAPPQQPRPPAPRKNSDRLAVAVGNASLLSVGYMMARRGGLAFFSLLVTFGLLVIAVPRVHSTTIEIVAVGWWLIMVVHGWFLGGGYVDTRTKVTQRIVAVCFALPVLLGLGLLRADAGEIGQTVTDARASGDCTYAMDSLDKVWFGLRIANAPLAVRGDATVEACRQLRDAGADLTTALNGSPTELNRGFATLGSVLAERPGHERMVDTTLDGFLTALPGPEPCGTVQVTEWLGKRPASNNTLDRSAEVVPELEPKALTGCADSYLADKKWQQARTTYQQLIKRYPNDPGKAKAQDGILKADIAIELDTVRQRLQGGLGSGQPPYCGNPAKYRLARPVSKGTNKTLFYGNSTQIGRLPGSWKATDVTKAVLVVCVGPDTRGAATRTCSYRGQFGLGRRYPVTFHKVAVRVKAYEIRTGRLVSNRALQFGGSSCPATISYRTPAYGIDTGPPRHMDVKINANDVRAQFQKVITR
ncbi:tetratricopeptide repeat protein [Paractinoplanes lichenicola]|uniref:Tetratricopeptide repeat protein n=1 Tax=Paractinoplanes lichenicola TaxID=2802976 RepID=A0ABS1VG15_9ACTN|nr:tetratricopeptide repeat protein [Actinoplanes lichenicola]MBL7253550.1 tetratricopeptide repeat protein [Actinoplanes lichenicola]